MKNLACILASLPSTLHPSIRQELQFSTPSVDVSSLSSTALYDVYYRRLSALYDPYETNQNIMVAKAAVAKGLVNGVRHVVFRSSIDQAVRGNISFGVMNSLSYVAKNQEVLEIESWANSMPYLYCLFSHSLGNRKVFVHLIVCVRLMGPCISTPRTGLSIPLSFRCRKAW